MVVDRQLRMVGEARRRTDRDGRAAFPHVVENPGHRRADRQRAEAITVFLRDVLGVRAAPTISVGIGNRAVLEQKNVVLRQISGVEILRIDHVEVELEVFEDHARPTGRHGAAVAVPEPDLHGLELHGRTRGPARHADEAQPLLLGEPLDGRSVGLEIERADVERLTSCGHRLRVPPRAAPGAQHAVHGRERVVDVRDQVSRCVGRTGDRPHRGGVDHVGNELERAVEPFHDPVELDAHLPRQRPSGVVVRGRRRGARIREVVGMLLLLEHVEHVRAERLVRLHHVRPGRITLPPKRERLGRAMHVHPVVEQRVHEFGGRREVDLARRDDEAAGLPVRGVAQETRPIGPVTAIELFRRRVDLERQRRPRVAATALDGVLPHAPDVEQQHIRVPRRVVEHRPVGGLRVFDGLAEVPRPGLDRKRVIGRGQLRARNERDLDRRRMTDGLGQQTDHVLEVRGRPKATVPPRRVRRPGTHGRAALPFLNETMVHGRAHLIEARDDEPVEVVVRRIAERRREHDRAGRARLVVVVDDLREPLAVHRAVHVLRLGQRRHVEVTVVVVTGVLLVQHRDRGARALERIVGAHVPIGDQVVTVRVRMRREDDHVVEDPQRLGVRVIVESVDHLRELLGAEKFRGVQPPVDPDDGLPLVRESAGLGLVQPVDLGEASRDLLVAVEIRVVLGRRYDRLDLGPALFGQADGVEHHAVGLVGQLDPVRVQLLVVDQFVVGSELVAEPLHRGRNPVLSRRGQCQR